ncbi:hypothetical protein Q9R38_16300 [Priestia aryabhattai]|nr:MULTISPECIES: hypothetical protein [Priestia]MDT0148080.1 hypothetical protein [Priestia aryabhattai]MDT0154054.1 hypothetical protein [Priestia aryabhattai]
MIGGQGSAPARGKRSLARKPTAMYNKQFILENPFHLFFVRL